MTSERGSETLGLSSARDGKPRLEFLTAEYKELRAEIRQRDTSMTQLFLTGVIAAVALTSGISGFYFNLYTKAPEEIPWQLSYFFLAPVAVIIPILSMLTGHRREIRRIASYIQVFYEEPGLGPTWESSHQRMALIAIEEAHDFVPVAFWCLFAVSIGLYCYGIAVAEAGCLWVHLFAPMLLSVLMTVAHVRYRGSKHHYYAKRLSEWRDIYRQLHG
jgi:hypothetical protein